MSPALRAIGALMACVFLTLGLVNTLALTIGSLWAGIGARQLMAALATVLYLFATAGVAIWLAVRPSNARAAAVAALAIPGLVFFYAMPVQDRVSVRQAASTWVANESEEAATRAQDKLLTQGRQAGNPPQVEILLEALLLADNDTERLRLVCMLGELSRGFEPLIKVLRELKAETADDRQRVVLHEVTRTSLYRVNPGEPREPSGFSGGGAVRPIDCPF